LRQVLTIKRLDSGLNLDQTPEQIRDSECSLADNVEFYRGEVRKARNFSLFSSSQFSEPVTFIDQFFDLSKGIHFFAFTPNHIYKSVDDGATWTEVTPDSGITGATIKDRWTSVQFPYTDGLGNFHDAYVVTNFASGILKYEPGDTNFSVLPGTETIKAATVSAYHNYLVLGRLEEDAVFFPQRVRWSDTGNAEVWDSGNAGYLDLIETADWIVGFATLRGTLYVFKERSIWRFYYRGSPDRLFIPELVVDGIGARSADALISIGDRIVFLGWDNIYEFDGVRVAPIGDEVQPELFGPDSTLNEDFTDAFWSIFLEERSELWTFFVRNPNESPDVCYRFNTADRSWSRLLVGFTGGGYYVSAPLQEVWSTATATWEEATYQWISQNLTGGKPLTLFGAEDGNIYTLDVYPLEQTTEFRTKNFVFDIPQRVFSARILGRGTFTASYSIDGGATWLGTKTFTIGSLARWVRLPVNRVTNRLMLRVTIPESEEGAISRLEIEVSPRSRLS